MDCIDHTTHGFMIPGTNALLFSTRSWYHKCTMNSICLLASVGAWIVNQPGQMINALSTLSVCRWHVFCGKIPLQILSQVGGGLEFWYLALSVSRVPVITYYYWGALSTVTWEGLLQRDCQVQVDLWKCLLVMLIDMARPSLTVSDTSFLSSDLNAIKEEKAYRIHPRCLVCGHGCSRSLLPWLLFRDSRNMNLGLKKTFSPELPLLPYFSQQLERKPQQLFE